MDTTEVFIEELDSNDVSEAELAQFQEVEVLDATVDNISDEPTDTGALIQRFVCDGETQLPEFCTKLEPEEELEELAADEVLDVVIKQESHRSGERPSTRTAVKRTMPIDNDDGDDDDDDDDDASMTDRDTSIDERTQRGAKRRTVLNQALQCMMGEANLSFARGQIEIAEKICLEIIRQNPLAPEPFITLAEIYETHDTEKHLNFLTIAAHLNPQDREQWIRIAEMHIAQKNYQQARVFYTKGIKVLPRDYDIRLRKARLLDLMGNTNGAKYTYLKALPHMPMTEAKLCLSIAQDVARFFHGLNKSSLALEAMQSAYNVCADYFTLEHLNLYMDLLLLKKEYARVLQCLRKHTKLKLRFTDDDDMKTVCQCELPDDFVPEFCAKLCVCLVHLDVRHFFNFVVLTVRANIEATSDSQLDLYIDVVEAFMHDHHYMNAYELLRPITRAAEEGEECPAFVWLRQAECLHQLNRINEAIESFTKVVDLAPLCYKARFTLSALLKQQGRHMEAVRVLEQPTDEDGMNPRLLYERCLMLHEIGEIDEFFEVGFKLLSRSSLLLRSREELLMIANGGNSYSSESLKAILQMRNFLDDTDQALQEYNKTTSDGADLTVQDEYELFLRLVRTAFEQRKYSFMERLCLAMVTTKRFVGYTSELERIIILSCYYNDDTQVAFSYLRELITKQLNNNALWNILSLLVQKGQELRYQRFMGRLFRRVEIRQELQMFLAHYYLHCSSYKYALNKYAPLYREQQHPLAALCMAVIFNQLSLQKRILRKTAATSHAITFVHKYAEWRTGGNENTAQETNFKCAAQQEIHYNIGRIYHQAGMTHLALEHYERALAAEDPLVEENEEYLGLKQEAAFNMHLIYRTNGNYEKARECLYKYCVI